MSLPSIWGTIKSCRLSKYVEILYESLDNTAAPRYNHKTIRNSWACVYIHLAGDVTYSSSRGTWTAAPLDIFTVDADETFSIHWGHKKPFQYYLMNFDKELFNSLFGYNSLQCDITMDFLDHEQHPNLIRLSNPHKDELIDILNTLDPLLSSTNTTDAMISALTQIVRLFELLYKSNDVKPDLKLHEGVSALVKNAVRYINQNFRDLSGLRDTAENLFVSPEYLSKKFRQEMGISCNDYLLEKKLAYGRICLRLGHNVAEAATEAGFSSASHFIQQYKKKYGVTPGKHHA